jgi:hypothetical protein
VAAPIAIASAVTVLARISSSSGWLVRALAEQLPYRRQARGFA